MRIAIASDHGGFKLKEQIKNYLEEQKLEYQDFGTLTGDSVDYPDYGLIVAQKVSSGEFDKGIIICGTGIGISISANKVPGIRAALCNDSFSAKASRQHNDANILALGERVTGASLALNIVETWLETEFEGGRHQRRVEKIAAIESQYACLEQKDSQTASLAQIASATGQSIRGLLERAGLEENQIIVVGCSTSEVAGARIGSKGSIAIAEVIMKELLEAVKQAKVYLAVQGCEHINRALVVEKNCAEQYGLEIVNVMPHQKAGGALAETAMKEFKQPVVVEKIQAYAGLDIGDTLIGMHLKQVAVPVRMAISKIGQAHVTFAVTRPKLIGGERAKYQ